VGFNVVLLEGVFTGSSLSINGGTVADALAQFIGERVRLAAHHLPADPIDPTRWGGGSCTYQPGPCPFGHHADPTRMYSVTAEGVLSKDGNAWTLTRFDGTTVFVGLDALIGHRGRVACAPMFDVEAMRDSVMSSGSTRNIGVKIDELRNVLERLRRS
jgi:hypothetical protein